MYTEQEYNSTLYHHGIKGQKWGIRRYQYENGSLTPEGRVHYGIGKERASGIASGGIGSKFKSNLQAFKEHKKANPKTHKSTAIGAFLGGIPGAAIGYAIGKALDAHDKQKQVLTQAEANIRSNGLLNLFKTSNIKSVNEVPRELMVEDTETISSKEEANNIRRTASRNEKEITKVIDKVINDDNLDETDFLGDDQLVTPTIYYDKDKTQKMANLRIADEYIYDSSANSTIKKFKNGKMYLDAQKSLAISDATNGNGVVEKQLSRREFASQRDADSKIEKRAEEAFNQLKKAYSTNGYDGVQELIQSKKVSIPEMVTFYDSMKDGVHFTSTTNMYEDILETDAIEKYASFQDFKKNIIRNGFTNAYAVG